MSFFSLHQATAGLGSANLEVLFDAERGTPELVGHVEREVPQIREIMADLRKAMPLVPHSGVGPIAGGAFYRLPNHYRSVSFVLPASASRDSGSSPGVIVFKGTEPLLSDFPAYFDWMLGAPFRNSPLPLALHFPMDMKLPPAAMWIEECLTEQQVSSTVQQRYHAQYQRLARLPLPLFVFRMTREQIARYEEVVRARIPADGMRKIKNKLADGLGVEVYYYPELPVRAADLFVGNTSQAFRPALTPDRIEATFERWTRLLAELLCLGYMPYAPWHHGMGGCVDPGNACIDGGFNDLLTLVPFEAISSPALFRNSFTTSARMLTDSMIALATGSVGIPGAAESSDATTLAVAFVTERLRAHVLSFAQEGHAVDARLLRYFEPLEPSDIVEALRRAQHSRGRPAQFVSGADASTALLELTNFRAAAGA